MTVHTTKGKLPESLGSQFDYEQWKNEHSLYAQPEPDHKHGWVLLASIIFSATVWAFALYGFWCFVSMFWGVR